MTVGEYIADSAVVSVDLMMSKTGRFGFGSELDSVATVPASEGVGASSVVKRCGFSVVGEPSALL